MKPLLTIEALRVRRGRMLLVDDFDLQLAPGVSVELRGANGTGKSTLLRCVAGLYQEFDGTIDAAEAAYVGHVEGLSGLLTVEENLLWYAGLVGQTPPADELTAALEQTDAAKLLRRPCRSLSAGQRRRVALARLLLLGRPLWLLDEPYTALDDDGARCVDAIVAQHCAGGGSVLSATHTDMVGSHDRVWIDGGRAA